MDFLNNASGAIQLLSEKVGPIAEKGFSIMVRGTYIDGLIGLSVCFIIIAISCIMILGYGIDWDYSLDRSDRLVKKIEGLNSIGIGGLLFAVLGLILVLANLGAVFNTEYIVISRLLGRH